MYIDDFGQVVRIPDDEQTSTHCHLDSCQVRHRTSTYDVVRTPYDIVRQTYDVGFNIARTTSYVRCYIRYCTYDIVRLSTS